MLLGRLRGRFTSHFTTSVPFQQLAAMLSEEVAHLLKVLKSNLKPLCHHSPPLRQERCKSPVAPTKELASKSHASLRLLLILLDELTVASLRGKRRLPRKARPAATASPWSLGSGLTSTGDQARGVPRSWLALGQHCLLLNLTESRAQ